MGLWWDEKTITTKRIYQITQKGFTMRYALPPQTLTARIELRDTMAQDAQDYVRSTPGFYQYTQERLERHKLPDSLLDMHQAGG